MRKSKPTYQLKIEQDTDAQAPDSWDDAGAWIVTTSNRYFTVQPKDWTCDRAALVARGTCDACKGSGETCEPHVYDEDSGVEHDGYREDCERCAGAPCAACDGENPSPDDAKLRAFPLRAYIHSGVALSLGSRGQFGDPWDSGQIGFVVVNPAELRASEDPAEREKIAEEAAAGIVETWNQFLSGDVWGYVVERVTTCDEGHEHAEHVDSCWGFYGREYAEHQGNEALEAARKVTRVRKARA